MHRNWITMTWKRITQLHFVWPNVFPHYRPLFLTSDIEAVVRLGGPLHPLVWRTKRVLQDTVCVEGYMCVCVWGGGGGGEGRNSISDKIMPQTMSRHATTDNGTCTGMLRVN